MNAAPHFTMKLHPWFFIKAIWKQLLALFEIYMAREGSLTNHINLIK